MSTITCTECSHIVLVRDGRGRCSHCGAEFEVEIRKVRGTELKGEELESRVNKHRG